MSRRVYDQTPKRVKIQQDILLQMRAARRRIDPALLDRARDAILKADPEQGLAGLKMAGEGLARADQSSDRARSLNVLKAYLKLIQEDKDLCRRIFTMIAEKP